MNGTKRIISTVDGRKICILEAGQPDGIPVLVHHGTPDSRLLYKGWIEDAERRGIRLIGYDRSGYGSSTPHPGRSVSDAAEEVAAIAKELNITRLLVWGASGGGPHALACAALLPDLVAAVAAISSPAPYGAAGLDWFAGMGEDNIAEYSAALQGREPLQQFVEASGASLLKADPADILQTLHSLLCPEDAAVFTDEYGYFVLGRVREGIGTQMDGWIDDDLAFVKPWGFELSQIHIPVLIVQGGQDRMVPALQGQWLAEHIPGVEPWLLKEDGHLTLTARRIPDVHAWLLSKR